MSCLARWNGADIRLLGPALVTGEPIAEIDDNRPVAKAGRCKPTRTICGVPQGRGSRRSRPMVGRKRRPEGSRMIMRKTSLILLGAAAGIAVTLIATQPRIVLDGARAQAAAADTYRQLSLFGDVFERVRADY